MADYSSIKGNRVQYLSTDPTLDSNSEGQVWYNTSTGTLKGLVHIKATSSGGNTPTNLYYPGGVGPTTATLAISGVGPSPIPAHTLCSDYSGYALGYSIETFLGPLETKYTWSPETKDSYWFLNMGFWF